MKLSFMILSHIRYVKSHRFLRIPLARVSFHRAGGSQFSGMFLLADLGGSTQELSRSRSLEKSQQFPLASRVVAYTGVIGAPWKGASSLWVRNPRNSFRFGW